MSSFYPIFIHIFSEFISIFIKKAKEKNLIIFKPLEIRFFKDHGWVDVFQHLVERKIKGKKLDFLLFIHANYDKYGHGNKKFFCRI